MYTLKEFFRAVRRKQDSTVRKYFVAKKGLIFSTEDIADIFSDTVNYDDPDALIEEIWNTPYTGDSDSFIDDLNDLFNN